MQREDESLSTRDLAGTQREVPVETAAEPATAGCVAGRAG